MYGWLKDEDPDSDDRCANTGKPCYTLEADR